MLVAHCHSSTPAPVAQATSQQTDTPAPTSKLTQALFLAALGLRVHPLSDRDKAPRLKGWQRLASTDPETIRQWWERWPEANIGLIVGPESGIMALDIDKRRGGERSLHLLEMMHPALPMTWQYSTADGARILFRHPEGLQLRHGELAPGIELIGDQGNSVGPGSIHPSGYRYAWMDGYDPGSVPLAFSPLWLRDVAAEQGLATPLPGAGQAQETRAVGSKVSKLIPLERYKPVLDPGGAVVEHVTPVSEPLTTAQMLALADQWSTWQVFLRRAGRPDVQKPGATFCCIYHKDEHPSASISPHGPAGKPHRYVDFHHEGSAPQFLPLGLAYYCWKTRKPTSTRLKKPSLVIWTARALADLGVIAPPASQAPKLKGDVPAFALKVYQGFVWLQQIRQQLQDFDPVPLSWDFGADWCEGVSPPDVGRGIKWLLARGYLWTKAKVGKLTLFLSGTRRLINRRLGRQVDISQKQDVIEAEVKQDVEAMLAEGEEGCAQCGRAGWWNALKQVCEWCCALAAQQRLLELRARLRAASG